MPNLWMGLCKGHHDLEPYAEEFRIQLGYAIHKFEPYFKLSIDRSTNPDVILTSKKVQNALVIEWTASQYVDGKKDQFQRYSHLSPEDLKENAAVPVTAGELHDVVIVVPENVCDQYATFLNDNNWSFPLLSFREEVKPSRHLLEKRQNELREEQTNVFFDQGVSLSRIPRNYIPFPLENVTPGSVAAKVVGHLISLTVRGEREFSAREFCSGYVDPWNLIDRKTQRDIENATKKTFSKLRKRAIGKKILKRVQKNPPRWRVPDRSQYKNRTKQLHKSLSEFVQAMEGGRFQPDLFDDQG